jgi:hypothetical protein
MWWTKMLNHPRGWGGKPTGSPADSRVAEISHDIGPGFLLPLAGPEGEKEVAEGGTTNFASKLLRNVVGRHQKNMEES